MVEQHCISYHIKLDNVLSISDYDVQLALCRAGHTAAFFPEVMLPFVAKDNNNDASTQKIHAFPIKNLHQRLRFDLVYNGLIHYPRYALDCFQIIKTLVSQVAPGAYHPSV